jgi:hypothetical protein
MEMFTTYRGDNRKPSLIHQVGFAPKEYFGIVWARKKIKEIFAGDAGYWAFDQIANHNNLYVVATDTMKKGQAFDRGDYIYKIEFPLLAEVRDYAAHGIEVKKGRRPFWPVLLTNRYDLDQATIIAVRISRPGFAQEVDFFTLIPSANIVGWKTELSGDDAGFNNFQG